MSICTTEILIVGGGPAGIAAAVAAADGGKQVTIVDDNPRLGGQIWRAELGKIKTPQAKELLDIVEKKKVGIVSDAQISAAGTGRSLLGETPDGTIGFEYEKLIIATGARERFLPFPGWTLPGVFGAGGLQALVKGGLDISGKRIIVAGTGPLLLAVADYLKLKGATIVAIIEQAPGKLINRFASKLWRSPSKLLQGLLLKRRLIAVPYRTNSWITDVSEQKASRSNNSSLLISLNGDGKTNTLECDYVACGFHLVPNTELAVLIGCELDGSSVAVDEFQETSVPNVFCAGEPTGIGGVEASLVEGSIAGHAAAGDKERARKFFAQRNKTRWFGEVLNTTFALRDELKCLSHSSTVVCRCEDVQYGKLPEFSDRRSAKLQTRCGMGPCQGRICGPAIEFTFGWKPDSVRPPIFPVKLENL